MNNLQNDSFYYRNNKALNVFWLITLLLISDLLYLFFLKASISAKSIGLTRPTIERTELKSVLAGIIDTLYVKEGDSLAQGQTQSKAAVRAVMPTHIRADILLSAVVQNMNHKTFINIFSSYELRGNFAFVNPKKK